MKDSILVHAKRIRLKLSKFKLIMAVLFFVAGLAIFQDYLFSIFQNTGFYLSESLLYNTFWLFFIPFFFLIIQLIKFLDLKSNQVGMLYTIGFGVLFTFLHLAFFTLFFVSISNLLYHPPHRFSSIFNAALSNQLYITVVFYTIAPMVYKLFLNVNKNEVNSISKYAETTQLKIGASIKTIKTSSIQLISTDKPYTVVHTKEHKFLQNKSLKKIQDELDPHLFLRVHRSIIVNKTFIKELKTRKNGDYDALLENGQWVRMSRHYRKNWLELLQ